MRLTPPLLTPLNFGSSNSPKFTFHRTTKDGKNWTLTGAIDALLRIIDDNPSVNRLTMKKKSYAILSNHKSDLMITIFEGEPIKAFDTPKWEYERNWATFTFTP